MITVGTATMIMPANVMANARYTVALSIILRSNTVSSLPLITLNTVASKTTNVVVLIPPPVEAEDAPINIKSMVNTCVILLSPPMLIEAYPAVRADADWKKAAFIFSPQFKCDMVLSHSHNKITPVPITSNVAVVIRTT